MVAWSEAAAWLAVSLVFVIRNHAACSSRHASSAAFPHIIGARAHRGISASAAAPTRAAGEEDEKSSKAEKGEATTDSSFFKFGLGLHPWCVATKACLLRNNWLIHCCTSNRRYGVCRS